MVGEPLHHAGVTVEVVLAGQDRQVIQILEVLHADAAAVVVFVGYWE